ncbi:MAG TPA: hypothetical protein DFS52_30355 [Myxococcales bacterium]|nr:hypothetical protein [Myxococcales bacterium]
MAIREGRWDCPQCGNQGNRGSELKCPACGRVRAEEVQFYAAEDAAEVTDEAALARAKAGADWICEFCGATTPADQKRCRGCSADRTEKRRAVKELLDRPEAPAPAPKKKSKAGLVLAGIGLLAIAGGLLLCRAKEASMTLAGVSWERTVEVEKYTTVVEEHWRDRLPEGARILSTERKLERTDKVQTGTRPVTKTVEEKVQTGTKKVKVGKKDLGNGYFEDLFKEEPVYETRQRTVTEDEPVYRDDPVYADWCRYEIDKWVKDRVEKASGADKSPDWPAVAATDKQRPGKKVETYRALFKDADGEEHEWTPKLDEWQRLEVGRKYNVVTRLGSVQGLAAAE